MSSIQAAKLGMGFQSAIQRPSCSNCKHVAREFEGRFASPSTSHWKCLKGGFMTSTMAICRQHEPKPTTRSTL